MCVCVCEEDVVIITVLLCRQTEEREGVVGVREREGEREIVPRHILIWYMVLLFNNLINY